MLSLSGTEILLGRSVDISREEEDDEDVNEENGNVNGDGNTEVQQRKILLQQASSFRDFEKLFKALNALEKWRDVAADCYE